MTERKDVKVTVVEQDVHSHGPVPFGSIWDEGSLKQLIDALRDIHKSIPKLFRKSAHVEITSRGAHDGSHHALITIGYRRPETYDERTAREEASKRSGAQEEADARQRYHELKARFEGSKRTKKGRR